MMSNNSLPMEDDDVDDFLYGSDALEGNYGTTSKLATKKNKETEEDDEIYEQYNESLAKSAAVKSDSPEKDENAAEKDGDAMDEDQDEDEESDDDVDIILEPEEDEHTMDTQQSSSQTLQEISNESTQSPSPLVHIKPGQQGKEASQSNNTTTKKSTPSPSLGAGKKSSGGIDLDAVGEYNGQPITEVDMDIFEDKPWRKPGADITDYFNFGFNEMSWRDYCAKQKVMNDKKVHGKVNMNVPDFMTGMAGVPDFMKMGMMNPMMNLPPPPTQLGNAHLSSPASGSSQPNVASISNTPNRSSGINPSGNQS